MALTRLLLCHHLLLLSFLVINASAHTSSDNGSTRPKGLVDDLANVDPLLTNNGVLDLTSFDELTDQLLPSINNQPEELDHYPPPQGNYNNIFPTNNNNGEQIQVQHEGPSPNNINNMINVGIQGVILCKAGLNEYYPLKGAVATITCPNYSYENGYNKASYSILSPQTDENGFFLATFSGLELTNKLINLKECKAYLEYSPSQSCNVPTGVGVNGASISLLHALSNENIYYTVGTLTYTSGTQYSAPISNDPVSNHVQYFAPISSPAGY